MVYKNMWPEPNGKYLPRDPKGKLLKVQDPWTARAWSIWYCARKATNPSVIPLQVLPEQKEGVYAG